MKYSFVSYTSATKSPSSNRTTGPIWTTTRTLGLTCPAECRLNKVCYSVAGNARLHSIRAEKSHLNLFEWINGLPAKAMVRHLISGDMFLNNQPDRGFISQMLEGHRARPDVLGWTYSHGWRRLGDPEQYQLDNLTVNASCETDDDINRALALGWPAVRTVATDYPDSDIKPNWIEVVCPTQTTNSTCFHCRLCAKTERVRQRKPIIPAFRARGVTRFKADRLLRCL